MKTIKKILIGFLCLVAAFNLSANGAQEGATTGATPVVTGMSINHSPNEPDPENPFLLKLEEMIGYHMDFQWIPSSAYVEKVNITMAAGLLPELVTVTANKDQAFLQAARAGAFWEVGNYIDNYPNARNLLSAGALINSSIDGKKYGVPRSRPLVRNGIVYREDWMQEMGLEHPNTISKLDTMVRAFAQRTETTMGVTFQGSGLVGLVRQIAVANGGANNWGVMDGKVTSELFFDEFMDALELVKTWYDDGIINSEFLLFDRERNFDSMKTGKTGVMMGAISDVTLIWEVTGQGAVFNVEPLLGNGTGDPKAVAAKGYNGVHVLPKSAVKTEADLDRVLTFLDRLSTPDICNLFWWGIEGVHSYIDANGFPKRDGEYQDRYSRDIQMYRQLQLDPTPGAVTRKGDNPATSMHENASKDATPYAVLDLSLPYVSDTIAEKGASLGTMVQDMLALYVLGEISKAEYLEERGKWLANGGADVTAEYQAQYDMSR